MDRFTVRLSSSHKPSGNTKPLVFKNPILTASGTFGYGVEFANYGDLTHLGGIVVKGLSLKPRPGNPLPRVAETPCGMLNAVGLQNDGVESFLKNKLPRLPWHETPVIANLYATSPAEFAELAGHPRRRGRHRRSGSEHLLPQREERGRAVRTGSGPRRRSDPSGQETRGEPARHREAVAQRDGHHRHRQGPPSKPEPMLSPASTPSPAWASM